MKIDRKRLYEIYMERIEFIVNSCDWKTSLTPEEIIDILSNVIEDNPELLLDTEDNDLLPAEEN